MSYAAETAFEIVSYLNAKTYSSNAEYQRVAVTKIEAAVERVMREARAEGCKAGIEAAAMVADEAYGIGCSVAREIRALVKP